MIVMAKKKMIFWVIAVTTSVAIGYACYRISKQFKINSATNKKSERKTREELLQEARNTLLSKEKVPVATQASALLRLAKLQDPLARQEALQLSHSLDSDLQRGAIQALGYFDDEDSQDRLAEIIAQSKGIKRIEAIKALRLKTSVKRRNLVKKLEPEFLLASKKNPTNEYVYYLGAALKSAESAGEAKHHTERLLAVVKNKDSKMRSLALAQLQDLQPKSAETMAISKEIIVKRNEIGLENQAWQHLLLYEPNFIKDQITSVLKSDNPHLKIHALQAMPYLCPPKKHSALEALISAEKDMAIVSAAAKTLKALGGAESVALASRLLVQRQDLNEETRLILVQIQQDDKIAPTCLE